MSHSAHVHAAQGVAQHRAVAPVGADEGRLPKVFDAQRVLAQQEGLQVAVHGRGDYAGPLGEGGAAQAVQARLAGQHLDHHQPDARGRRQDRLHIGNL